MQLASCWRIGLGGLAVVLLVVTPAAAASAASADLKAATPPAPLPLPMAAPDTLVHVVRSGDNLRLVAGRYRAEAGYYTVSECLRAVREASDMVDRDLLRPGDRLFIPIAVTEDAPVVTNPVSAGAEFRGLYLPAVACGRETVFQRLDAFIAAGGNAVIIDAKDIDGGVSFRSQQPQARYGIGCVGPYIADLPGFVDRLHARDLWVVARLALFLDGRLGTQRPDLALADTSGSPWTERGYTWLDAAAVEVQAYNRNLALELAAAGVDEVQLDYVRFPTNGWRGDWQGDLDATADRRRRVITGFVASLRDTLSSRGCRLSAAVFGIAAWGRTEDLALTGQHLPDLASHLDVLCPMIYPSHFAPGFEGLDEPADHPELMINNGVIRCRDVVGDQVPVRPWLQAFAWRVSDYDSRYVRQQIDAAMRAGATGWSLWNPAGRYEVATTGLLAADPTP